VNRLPISGSAFDRLGRHLAEGAATDVDLDQFEEVRLVYGRILEAVQAGLSRIGTETTGRVKTTGTLIDKLRRTPGLTIRGIHDLAGCRLVVMPQPVPFGTEISGKTVKRSCTLSEGRISQDVIVGRIVQAFNPAGNPFSSKAPRIVDRRLSPSAGYRAVHVIVFIEGIPVEIQVRTRLQHMWAEATERLADRWGRGLRYGQGPDDADSVVEPGVTRRHLVEALVELADAVAAYEEAQVTVDTAEVTLACLDEGLQHAETLAVLENVRPRMRTARDGMDETLRTFLTIIEGME
jgi:ppGpp synthetase/RelA/SpoT-type nucleotidyltranferase